MQGLQRGERRGGRERGGGSLTRPSLVAAFLTSADLPEIGRISSGVWAKKHTCLEQLVPSLQSWVRYLQGGGVRPSGTWCLGNLVCIKTALPTTSPSRWAAQR